MTKMLLNHTLLPDSLSRGFFRNGVEVPDIENVSSIDSQLRFLERKDLYSTEKPYSMRYRPKNGFSPSNLVFTAHDVTVRDMRPLLPALSLDVNGFEVHKMQTSLSRNDFDDYHTVHAGYIRELEQYVKKIRGAAHVHALDYELRKRHEIFPLSTGEEYAFGQPAMSVHVDITLQSARSIVRELYGDHAEKILESRLEVVTAWKPIIGPVRDWPLALCDSRTIDRRSDVIPADAVYRKFVAENCMVHHNHDQRWYYLRDQEIDELLLFKATDSDLEKSIVCAHGAFDLGANTAQPPRESIDVRMLVMYANIEYPETNAWSL